MNHANYTTSRKVITLSTVILSMIAQVLALGTSRSEDVNIFDRSEAPMRAMSGTFNTNSFRLSTEATVPITNVEELYSAVNDPANSGATLLLAPGVYALTSTDPGGAVRPNRGRLELQEDMSLLGVVGDRNAVVIDAFNLPAPSFRLDDNRQVGGVRIGRGRNSIEWMTFRDARFGTANIQTSLQSPGTAYVRVAHVSSSGSNRGLDVINFGPESSGETIEADVVDNDFFNNKRGPINQGVRIANFGGVASVINARVVGNRAWDNRQAGRAIANNGATNSSVNVFSTGNRFYGNSIGTAIYGGFSGSADQANGNRIDFEAHGDWFVDNTISHPFDVGGLGVSGAENGAFPNRVNNNTVNVRLWGCRMSGNLPYDLIGIGARSLPESIGSPGANNHATIEIHGAGIGTGRWEPTEALFNSVPFDATTTNSVTVIR